MNILIVGLGSIALKHIEAIHSLKIDAKIFALRSNLNADCIENVHNIYDLKDESISFDFAIISNPTQNHAEYIELLANKGVNLFIEKPPISEISKADDLINLITQKNIKSYVACNLRFHPCIEFLKKYITTETIQDINEVNIYCGSYLPDWRPNKNFRTVYSANPEMGGGVHLDLFHEIDYTYWLFGVPEKTKCLKRNVSSLKIKAIDYANYWLLYPNFTANIVLNYYRNDTKRTIEIVFKNETWIVDLVKNCIMNNTGNIIFKDDQFTMKDSYTYQMQYFINSLKANQKQLNTFAESIDILKICLSNE